VPVLARATAQRRTAQRRNAATADSATPQRRNGGQRNAATAQQHTTATVVIVLEFGGGNPETMTRWPSVIAATRWTALALAARRGAAD